MHKKTKNLPLPRRGRALCERGRGDGGRKTLIRQENPASKTAVPPLGVSFAPCSGAPLGKPPAGQRQRRFSPCRPGSVPGMQGAKPLA